MMKRKTFLIGFNAAAIALFAGVYVGQQGADSPPQAGPSLSRGAVEKLFASTLSDTDGKPRNLAQWRGKTLVVNFWATWCPPCREEMPGFSRLHAKHAANDVQFVGIALDNQEIVRAFAKQFPVTYPLLIGGENGADLAQDLGNSRLAMPFTVIISPEGAVRFARLGGLSEPELDTLLQSRASH